jgi:hypothetical protein
MTDPKQPSYVPVVAGDLTDTSVYPVAGKPWDGVLALQIPATGTYSAGFTPDQSWFGAQSINGILQNLGQHLEAIADGPTFQVNHPKADLPGDTADYTTVSGSGHYNQNTSTDLPQIYGGYRMLISQVGHKSGGTAGRGFVRRWRVSSGTGSSFESDQTIQNPATAGNHSPFTDGTNSAGDTPAGDGDNPVVIGVSRTTPNIISLGSTRTVTLSTDYGDTWAGATALNTNANWHWPLCAIEFNGVWAVVDQCDSSVNVSRLQVSGDLTAAAWTTVGGSLGGSNSGYVRRMCCNSDILVLLPDQNTLLGYWHAADPGMSTVRIATADGTRTGWRGAWNEQIGMFLIGNEQGDLWTSADGQTWTQVASNLAGLCVRDIVAHGRGFVISNSGAEWAVDYCDFDRKRNLRFRRLYEAAAGNSGPTSGFHLAAYDGRWFAARVTLVVVGGPTNYYRLEWVYSGVNQWDKNNAVGR